MDIVIGWAFLLGEGLRCAPQRRADARNAGAHSTRETNVGLVFQNLVVPADGISAANCENGGFGMSPFFGQHSRKPLLATVY
jgi:hypothetical protein